MARYKSVTGTSVQNVVSGNRPNRTAVKISPEENAFITEAIARGLTDVEVTRMFFRRYARSIDVNNVRRRRNSPPAV